MRPSIGGLPVYYYFISNFATFPKTNTPVLTDYRISHPQMTILQIQMISRIGWTILTLFALPYSMIGYCLLLSCHALHIWGVVSLVYCPPSPWCWVCFLLLPIPPPIFVQSYSFVLHSSASEPVTELDYPTIPRSTKAIAREAWIRLIRGFLETRAQPADLSDTEFHSFVNSELKFFLLHGSLWHREPHGRHQLVVPEHRHFGLIKEAHDDLRHKGVFTVRTRLLLRFWRPMLVEDVKWFIQTCHECQIHQSRRLHIPPTVLVISGLFCKVHLDMMVMPRSAGYQYIVQAHCALTAYPKWPMLHSRMPPPSLPLFLKIFSVVGLLWPRLSLTMAQPLFRLLMSSPTNTLFVIYASPPITPRLTVWSSGVTLMSGRPSSKAPWGWSSAGIPQLTRSFGLSA